MGAVLKFLVIFFLGTWLLRSILRGVLGRMFRQTQQSRNFQQQHQQQRRTRGDINVDFNPRSSRKNKTSDEYKGGDYIEYEEVD